MFKKYFGWLKQLYEKPAIESDERLWLMFLSARIALALTLVFIQVLLYLLQDPWAASEKVIVGFLYVTIYLLESIIVLWFFKITSAFEKWRWLLWLFTLGLDLAVFFWLYWLNYESTAFFMLFVFSVLMAATLGTRFLLYSVCTAIILLVLIRGGVFSIDFYRNFLHARNLIPQLFAAGGVLIVGELTRSLASRMRKGEHQIHAGLISIRQQEGLNRLIVSEMSTGVIVGDGQGQLKMINPAGIALVTGNEDTVWTDELRISLAEEPGWKQLQGVMKILFESGVSNRWLVFDFMLDQGDRGSHTLQVKGRVMGGGEEEKSDVTISVQGFEGLDSSQQKLCVLFLSDMRDVDRRMQQEKLAAMGRMSASIAHEIRNPLATISSANTLLAESLTDRASLRLTEMIATNASRLNQIVKDVLDVAHLEVHGDVETIDLLFILPEIVDDWARLHQVGDRLVTYWPDDVFGVFITFSEEHLRRVIVNLLDNALRYADMNKASIFVTLKTFQAGDAEKVRISVYSDGTLLEANVQRTLFEPFFSTEARGTGLGLYIGRNLCHRYDADLEYRRAMLTVEDQERDYNEFYITANRIDPLPGETQVMIEQVRYPSDEGHWK